MAGVVDLFEGLLFGGKKQKQPEPPPLPPPDDVDHEAGGSRGGLPSFVRTEGRLRGAPTPFKRVLGVEK